jgi:antitoxin CptB
MRGLRTAPADYILGGQPMLEHAMETRRRKLTFRAWRRGFREMDLYMGSFADKFLPDFNEAQLDEFERLLAVPDWDVYAWLIGQKDVPDKHKGPVLDQLVAFRYAAQAG